MYLLQKYVSKCTYFKQQNLYISQIRRVSDFPSCGWDGTIWLETLTELCYCVAFRTNAGFCAAGFYNAFVFVILPSVLACYTKEITGKGRAVARGDFVAPLYGLGSADILAV